MTTLYRPAPPVVGQFDDASDDETYGVRDDRVILTSTSGAISAKRGIALATSTPPTNLTIACQPRILPNTNRQQHLKTSNRKQRNDAKAHSSRLRRTVNIHHEEVSDNKLPVRVVLTKHFPSREVRGSSSRATEESKIISQAKPSRVCMRLKAQPHRRVLSAHTTMSMQTSTETQTAAQETAMKSAEVMSENHGLNVLRQRSQTKEASSTMTKSPNLDKVTPKVMSAAPRSREVETAEVLRSLRQTNKMSPKQPITKYDGKTCTLPKEEDDIEVIGVFPRPSELYSRTSVFSRVRSPIKPSGSHDTRSPMSMLPGNRNDKRPREVVQEILQETTKKRQRFQEQSFGEARQISGALQKVSASCVPTSVTPPLSSIPSIWESSLQREAEISLGAQRRHHEQKSVSKAPVVKREVPAPAVKTPVVPSRTAIRPTPRIVPQPQAPRFMFTTKLRASAPQRHGLCMLPPHLLPPPVVPTMRSKMAVEGFVAPFNVPCIAEDKERRNPIPNIGLRKRDVLFFAPLVRYKVQHQGTLQYCFLCFKYQELFLKSNAMEKRELLNNLVRYVRAHGGRFLEWDDKQSCWFEIGDVRAAQRTMLGFSKDAPQKRDETTKR